MLTNKNLQEYKGVEERNQLILEFHGWVSWLFNKCLSPIPWKGDDLLKKKRTAHFSGLLDRLNHYYFAILNYKTLCKHMLVTTPILCRSGFGIVPKPNQLRCADLILWYSPTGLRDTLGLFKWPWSNIYINPINLSVGFMINWKLISPCSNLFLTYQQTLFPSSLHHRPRLEHSAILEVLSQLWAQEPD